MGFAVTSLGTTFFTALPSASPVTGPSWIAGKTSCSHILPPAIPHAANGFSTPSATVSLAHRTPFPHVSASGAHKTIPLPKAKSTTLFR